MLPPWMTRSACLDVEVEQFYLQSRYSQARDLCAGCPVRRDCLEYALSRPVTADYGLWGGTTENERKSVRRQNLPVETAAEVLDTLFWHRASGAQRERWVPLADDQIIAV